MATQEQVKELAKLHELANAAAQVAYDFAYTSGLTYVPPTIEFDQNDENDPNYFESSDSWSESEC